MTVPVITRPALRYLGGKFRMAPWIIRHFPAHRVYVEPFGGAASVLLRKPRSNGEVWNDLDGELVNYFRVLRDPSEAAALVRQLALTPYARTEFEDAYEVTTDPVERARRLVVRSFMGFGSNAGNIARDTGFRGDARREYSTPVREWSQFPEALLAIAERVQSGVQLECRPALDVIAKHDAADVLFYVDPPYAHGTRGAKRKHGRLHNAYHHEMDDDGHGELLQRLNGCAGMVVLSGYRCELYDFWLKGWRRVERQSYAHGALPRTESLWLNPAADRALAAEARR